MRVRAPGRPKPDATLVEGRASYLAPGVSA